MIHSIRQAPVHGSCSIYVITTVVPFPDGCPAMQSSNTPSSSACMGRADTRFIDASSRLELKRVIAFTPPAADSRPSSSKTLKARPGRTRTPGLAPSALPPSTRTADATAFSAPVARPTFATFASSPLPPQATATGTFPPTMGATMIDEVPLKHYVLHSAKAEYVSSAARRSMAAEDGRSTAADDYLPRLQ